MFPLGSAPIGSFFFGLDLSPSILYLLVFCFVINLQVLTRLMERGYTPLRVGYFVNPPNPCNFMVLMEGGLCLTEEWVIHFVNPPNPCNFMVLMEARLCLTEEWVIHFVNLPNPCNFMVLMEGGLCLTEEWVTHLVNPPNPCNFMGLSPRQKKKGIFPKCFIISNKLFLPLPKRKP